MLLIIAFFVGAAAVERFDQGKTDSAWFLAICTVALIVATIWEKD